MGQTNRRASAWPSLASLLAVALSALQPAIAEDTPECEQRMLWLDGVYEPVAPRQDKPRLHRARTPPPPAQLTRLTGTIARRVCRHLVRKGWLEGKGEDESAFLSNSAGYDDGMDGLRMSSITYRIVTGA